MKEFRILKDLFVKRSPTPKFGLIASAHEHYNVFPGRGYFHYPLTLQPRRRDDYLVAQIVSV